MDHPQCIQFRVLLKADQCGHWVAHALEVDVVAQGRNLAEAKSAFVKTMIGHIVLALKKQRVPFEGIGKAPKSVWNLFEKGEELSNPIMIPASARRKFRNTAPILPESIMARVA
ncbi:MAG TPA: hypothetical protein VL981_06320 [Candidatus Methylacidiphilales bacterium]|nr:hypothetical protein [Candidatus Methylacidiphilales bacterium]